MRLIFRHIRFNLNIACIGIMWHNVWRRGYRLNGDLYSERLTVVDFIPLPCLTIGVTFIREYDGDKSPPEFWS